MTITLKCANQTYTLANAHAPINKDNITDCKKVDDFWETLEEKILKIPQNHVIILLGDFNVQLGKERRYGKIIGKYPAHKWTN